MTKSEAKRTNSHNLLGNFLEHIAGPGILPALCLIIYWDFWVESG